MQNVARMLDSPAALSEEAPTPPSPEPEAPPPPPEALTPSQRYLNRELSWLAFNYRVLEEAQNPQIPLLERVRFLAICDTNLDEFTTVRMANLKSKLEAGVEEITDDGLTISQQLDIIYEDVDRLLEEQQATWRVLGEELTKAGIRIVDASDLEDEEFQWLTQYFVREIMPVLTPLACDPAHPFPFIPNDGLCMGLKLKDGKSLWALLPLPSRLPRFIRLSTSLRKEMTRMGSFEGQRMVEERFLPLERAIPLFFDRFLGNFKVKRYGLFHVLRDAEMEMETTIEQGNLAEVYLTALKVRKRGHAVRLNFDRHVPEDMRQWITTQLEADPEDVFEVEADGLMNLSDISQLCNEDRPELKFPHYEVRFPERIKDSRGDYFTAISNKGFIVHHPYESFDSVVEFLRQAARDPDVLAIKQTLYRTSKISDIVRALVEAAEAGKSVTVVVELKARFDEEANIRLANDLERAGAHVVYGFTDLKTHAKMSMILRRESKGLKGYVHFGTGNYHPLTAKIYTDLSYFTCDEALVRDAAKVFNYLTGYATPGSLEKLAVAPVTLKKTILELIQEECEHVKAGRPGAIWAKMNSLVDSELCDALYRASQIGVTIDLIVRGICCLRPGVPGLSENIRVKSIVGRFLEHSRVLCFGNGHALPHKKAKVFISSADWMPRNMHTRVEFLVPIETDSVHAQLIDQVMVANLKDTRNSWLLGPDGVYRRNQDRFGFSAHEYFMNNPSLSGRGKLRRRHKPTPTLSL